MSQATRAIALQEAIKAHTKDGNAEDADAVLTMAGKFQAWLDADSAADGSGNPAGEAPTAPAAKKGPGRPPKAAAPAATEPDPSTETSAESADDLKQKCGETLSAAIKVDRDKAVAVLAKFGASSLSTIKAKDYVKVTAALQALLPDPALQ